MSTTQTVVAVDTVRRTKNVHRANSFHHGHCSLCEQMSAAQTVFATDTVCHTNICPLHHCRKR